jgi:hypothetical protein
MADDLGLLLSKAFRVVPGPRSNEVSQGLRETRGLFFYEVILPPDSRWEFLRDRVYPSLARYLQSKSLDPGTGGGAVVSLFRRDSFFLISGADFMETYGSIEGLDPQAFQARVLGWLSAPEEHETPEEKDSFRPTLPAPRK